MNLTAVLYLEPLTRSISFRPYLAHIDHEPVLAILAKNALRCGADRFVVLSHYEDERPLLQEALNGTCAELRPTPHFSELQAATEIILEAGEGNVAFFRASTALAPGDLLRRVAEHHKAHGNSFTLVDGLPGTCTLRLYTAPVLASLLRGGQQMNFLNPESAMRRLLLLNRELKRRIPISGIPFNFCASYGIVPEQLPLRIPLIHAGDWELCNKAASETRESWANSANLLCRLKELQIVVRAERCRLEPVIRARNAKDRKRVLYLSLASAFSGAEQALCSMVRFVDRTRFELFAVTAHEGVFAAKLREAGAQTFCPEWDIMNATIDSCAYFEKLFRRIAPDVIHLNGKANLAILAPAMSAGIPIVQHIRNGDMDGFEDGLILAQKIIAITEFLKRETLRFPVEAGRIEVIPDEVDAELYNPDLFSKSECRAEFELEAEAPVVLMVARVVSNKRYDVMLHAAAMIRENVPGFRLVLKGDVYGESGEHLRVQTLIRELGLRSSIQWFDFVPDIRRLMAAADVLVLCSDREGLGSCVVEAMSMALPVVVTNSGGTHEIVDSGIRGGFIVTGGDFEALAARVTELLRDKELCRRLGQSGREYVRTHLDARVSSQSVMKIYTSLCDDTSTPIFAERIR
jgi:glycosyltransferase involved in cell wall biosynthesis